MHIGAFKKHKKGFKVLAAGAVVLVLIASAVYGASVHAAVPCGAHASAPVLCPEVSNHMMLFSRALPEVLAFFAVALVCAGLLFSRAARTALSTDLFVRVRAAITQLQRTHAPAYLTLAFSNGILHPKSP